MRRYSNNLEIDVQKNDSTCCGRCEHKIDDSRYSGTMMCILPNKAVEVTENLIKKDGQPQRTARCLNMFGG